MKTLVRPALRRALLISVFILPAAHGASINFETLAHFHENFTDQSDPKSGDNGPSLHFIASTVNYDSPFYAQYYGAALATVNGWIGVAASSHTWEGQMPFVDAHTSWAGTFTNPYVEPLAFEVDLSFGAGFLFVDEGSDPNGGYKPSVDSHISVNVFDKDGVQHVLMDDESTLTLGGLQTAAFNGINWQSDTNTASFVSYRFAPFEFVGYTPVIAPGDTFTLLYAMGLDTYFPPSNNRSGAGSGGTLNDPFDVNGHLRTEAPANFGGLSVQAINSAAPEPSTFWLAGLAATAVLFGLRRQVRA